MVMMALAGASRIFKLMDEPVESDNGTVTLVNVELERSAWCREQGLYVHELDAWREAFEGMDDGGPHASRSDMARERKRVSRLQKELERKEKALAEAAALLVLSKKAQAIWGVDGEA